MRWTRRNVLRTGVVLTGGAATGLWLPSCDCGSAPASSVREPAPPAVPSPIATGSGGATQRVIVIGAGMAGLAAAREIAASGASVLVLEQRDRVGGRVWTDRSLGFPMERGAHWIEGTDGNPIVALAREAGARTVVDPESVRAFDYDGRELLGEELEAADCAESHVIEEIAESAEEHEDDDDDLSIGDALREEADEDESPFEHRVHELGIASLETDTGGSTDRLSLLGYDDPEAGYEGHSHFLPDGYDALPRFLAQTLDVRLGVTVRAVRTIGARVVVVTDAGEETADAVVVAVPLGALRADAIQFDPPLPDEKRDAIAGLEMGTLDKVILRFPEAFWGGTANTFLYASQTRGELPLWVDWNAISGVPALVMFSGGDYALAMEARDDRAIVSDAMRILRSCFGADAPDPTATLLQRWQRDPITHGSYSFVPVGSSVEARVALAAPIGERIFFAGEATNSVNPATVHGAYESGLRVASEIIEALGLEA